MSHTHPVENRPVTIGLIGGRGKMGLMFKAMFESDGCKVLVAGRKEAPDYTELVEASDVIITTVPIDKTTSLMENLAPNMRPEQLLSDFTSIKAEPLRAMLKSPSSVIGCHPLFGPMPTAEGQNVVLCPERPGPWLGWYRDFFERHGMRVSEMTPAAHDEAMAFIQGLTHFINIVFARTLQTREADLKQILEICSPVYQLFFSIMCRILSGDSELYGQIQISNPNNPPVLGEFLKNAEGLLETIKEKDAEGVYRIFDEAAENLGDFKQIARDESNFLITQLTRYLREKNNPDKS